MYKQSTKINAQIIEKDFLNHGGQYKPFKLSQLFDISGTKSLDEGYLEFVEDGINFVGRVDENNGIKGKIKKQNFEPNEPFTITATVIGNYKYVKFQTEPYYCSQNINKLIPKFKINTEIALYFIALVNKFTSIYNGQQGGYKLQELQDHEIILPVNMYNEIDYNFIEKYIRELEEERIRELTAYLIVSGYKDCKLTSQEKKAIYDLNNNKIEFKEFNITGPNGIFDVKNTHSILQEWIVSNSGNVPYVTAGVGNNSITTYITPNNTEWIEKGHSIMIGGKTLVITYQEQDYVSNDSHNLALYFKDNKIYSENIYLFLVTALYKSLKPKYEWGDSISKTKIQKDIIKLPINDSNEINFNFMETYISAIKKLTIKNVVDWRDKQINATKQVVNNV